MDVPKNINEEVSGYLGLVKLQSQKPKPSQNIVKSNLKNAAEILDEYITKTLNKPSKVVTGWINALLLQNIEYKTPINASESIETKITSKINEEKIQENIDLDKQQIIQEKPETKISTDPENIKLNNLYKQSEKFLNLNEYDKALLNYEKVLESAKSIGNKYVETDASMDIAYIHDVNNNLSLALENYNNAANLAKFTGDRKTQAKAYYNMATIYDDVGKSDLALEHYHASLGFDGDTENLKAQATTLNNIGNIFANTKQYKTALDYYKLAFILAKEDDDKAGKAFVLSNTAEVFKTLGFDDRALKCYKDAIKFDKQAGNIVNCAKNYEHAGDIMLKNSLPEKSQNLYKKSLFMSQKIGDKNWSARLTEKINNFADF
ncbi:MAG: tetratricopeptide repeat protein [bacterium]